MRKIVLYLFMMMCLSLFLHSKTEESCDLPQYSGLCPIYNDGKPLMNTNIHKSKPNGFHHIFDLEIPTEDISRYPVNVRQEKCSISYGIDRSIYRKDIYTRDIFVTIKGEPRMDYINYLYGKEVVLVTRNDQQNSITEFTECYYCHQPSDPTPTPPKDTNTTVWKLVGETSCKDKNTTLPPSCSDANASGIVVQTWKTGCCGENKRCYVSTPICDENQTLDMNATPPICKDKVPPLECDDNQTLDTSYDPPICVPQCDENQTLDRSVVPPVCKDNVPECTEPDTTFPVLKFLDSIIFSWAEPEDKSSVCSTRGGNTEQRRVSCKSNYRCTCPYVPYLPKANNEEVLFTWSTGTHRSAECTSQDGRVQEAKVACRTDYRCVKKTDTPPKECDELISSYVSPRDGIFHEDIEVTGADFGLHYSSANVDDMTVAHGWSISSHARLEGSRLYYGSGSIYVVEPVDENGYQVVTSGSKELLFDANGQLQSIRDLYTKEPKNTFGYDNMGRLVTLTDIYGQISTIERDGNGTVTAIIAPRGQRTLLSVDGNGDLLEVQYEDTSSYAFEYERHLMTKETEPKGNVFLHFFDAHGKVVKVIDAEQGEWHFNSSTKSTAGTHTVTRASGDVVTYKNHFLENGVLKTEKTLPTGDVVLYENAIDDANSTVTSCGMQTVNIYKKNADGTLYKDPYTHRRVLERSTVTTPSGLSKTTYYSKKYTTNNGTLSSIETTTDTNNKPFTNLRDYTTFRASTTTAEQKQSHITYDSHNQNIQSIKPYGTLKTSYVYDDKGRVIETRTGERVTHYSYDDKGRLTSTTNPLNQTTTYSYDSRDRLTSTTYADGHSITYSYDANGNMTQLTTPTPSDHTFLCLQWGKQTYRL